MVCFGFIELDQARSEPYHNGIIMRIIKQLKCKRIFDISIMDAVFLSPVNYLQEFFYLKRALPEQIRL